MPGRVFISCGQATEVERTTAATVADWLKSEGFRPYVAIKTQSLSDVTGGIIAELKRSDYYLFVDFAREQVRQEEAETQRGSLFTHQELAMAYLLDFEHAVFFRQRSVRLEGIGAYLLTNADVFESHAEVLPLVQAAVTAREWSPAYSRHLVASMILRSGDQPIPYSDHHGTRDQFIWIAEIVNARTDLAAFDAIARLTRVYDRPIDPEWESWNAPDRRRLKWAFEPGYQRTIPPESGEAFDAFALEPANPSHLYLHSAADVYPRRPTITKPGDYVLRYEVYAREFPPLTFDVQLALTGDPLTTKATIIE